MDSFDDLVPDATEQTPATTPQGALSFDGLVDDEEKYGTTEQQVKAGLEGVGRGIAGPLFTGAEKMLGVKPEAMRGREEANPITAGVGEAAGLGAGLLTGTGEAAVMMGAGKLAQEAVGLSNLAKEASWGMKVGSSAVQQAAEMAVLQSGTEASKFLMEDPESSAEAAIANIGMAAALGGATGAFFTGAVSPLWDATAGPHVESMLNGLKEHLNGNVGIIPEATADAISKLGIEPSIEIKGALTGGPAALERFNVLKEVQNKTVLEGIEKLNKDASESVMNSLGISKEAIEIHSDSEAGHNLLESFKKEYNEKYQPLAEKFAKRDIEAAGIAVSDEARLNTYGNLLEKGMEKMGTDSPYYKLYNDYGNRILAKDTIGGLDQIKKEINGVLKAAYREGDSNKITVLNDIKSSITDFQERQIAKNDIHITDQGRSIKKSSELLNERAELNRSYSEFSKMSDELTNHLGVGDFKGAGTLESKLTGKLSPEEVLKKFSIRNNADFIKFLSENFPETLQHVQLNELKKILKPAVLAAKEGEAINVKKLSDTISKGLAGQREYIESIISKEALEKIGAAERLHASLPGPKSSGTAGWMTKVMSKMPQSAMAAVAMVTGHNPVFGYLGGEMASKLGRSMPDAINLGYLRFLGSEQPVKAGGFKAMVDFFHSTAKGVKFMNTATQNVFKTGTRVLAAHQMPAKADTEKLDKLVTKYQAAPNTVFANQNTNLGHYLPNHQAAASEVSTRALQYLQSIKPQPHRNGPLDRTIEPSAAEKTRYQRALDIAQQPAVILQHVKDGTIKASDMADLGAMYPGLYKTYAAKLSTEMQNHKAEDGAIPYKTRMGLSLFLGQPLDTSMKPLSIASIQSIYAPKQLQQAPGQGKTKKGTTSLGKNNKDYRTPIQASEAQDSERK